ncbi:MAG: hypothetical protein BroJett029_36040 [Alphaproteobacteria bacterium]|nr:MAG: hypothetical protein BroJett029_36040 [Alphaproteobacteria bacterium]
MRAVVLMLVLALGGAALPPGTPAVAQEAPDVVDIVFTEIEKRIIRAYYERAYGEWAEAGKGKNKGLPPGLARKGSLPPGLAKQLARNGTLPPGLAKRLPSDLVPLLPLRPDWQDVVIVDDKVLLIRRATNLILDIIEVAAAEAAQ